MNEPCEKCATWVCDGCGWKKTRADLRVGHGCTRCGGVGGTFRDKTHRGPFSCPGLTVHERDAILVKMRELRRNLAEER
jgi:hypothetical protein